ncbi:hypothetical protein B0H14DRAFT_2586085 [Mycena olivaceomarginata]|nr:hypothetical protein B0H14DRAFT_2586085 [Mycena olivaceomarginata]
MHNQHLRPRHPPLVDIDFLSAGPRQDNGQIDNDQGSINDVSREQVSAGLPVFSFTTTAEKVATVFSQEIKGKNVLITGTLLNGIGFETACGIARHANLVIITGYNDERSTIASVGGLHQYLSVEFRLQLSEDAIKADVPNTNIHRLLLDLSSLASVLIHNAAAAIGPLKLTVDGLESQMATGHVGPFLFMKILKPKLLAAETGSSYTPRVVFVASVAHMFEPGINFDTVEHPSAEAYTSFGAYFEAKSANILTAIKLSKRS